MITLISIPSTEDGQKWLATECPNIFRFLRQDYEITAQVDDGHGFFRVTATAFDGAIGDTIALYNATNGSMYAGKITDLDGTDIYTDIPYVADAVFQYMNDDTVRAGYFVECRLWVNDVLQRLTVMASPDPLGYSNVDVSGLLRIMVAVGKAEGSYDNNVVIETNKGGSFVLDYRECWYGSNEQWYEEDNNWAYVEAVRSVEQGSSMYEYVAQTDHDGKVLNSFERPVFFAGLPFDLSLIVPDPDDYVYLNISRYSAAGILLGSHTVDNYNAEQRGRVVSAFINPAAIEPECAYMIVEPFVSVH